MSTINSWMSWEGGVDLCAATREGLAMPNVLIHVARMVHTPAGSAPSGMVLYQPDPVAPPAVIGFVSHDSNIGAYFGPHIFAGTPFENVPVLPATIETEISGTRATSRLKTGDFLFEVELTGLGAAEHFRRDPGGMTPFTQDVVEAVAASASLKVNGSPVSILVPTAGITGGAAAVAALTGLYTR
jgi:hypothetical protein